MRIATLNNPLDHPNQIDSEETDLKGREYPHQDIKRNAQDRVRAWTAEKTFHAAYGPRNPRETLAIFRASLHTLTGEGGYVTRQRAFEMDGMGSGVVAPATAAQIPTRR